MKKSALAILMLLFPLVIGSVGFVNPVRALVEEGVTTNPVPPGYGFIDFEEGTEGEAVASTVPGVAFTTTMGLDWLYADIRTGVYNARSLTDPSVNFGNYVVNGYFCAWLGVSGDQGRIDFTMGTASYFSALFSTASGVTVDAYDSDDNLIATSGWAGDNWGTFTFTRLTVEAPGIAYVMVHDSGNYWEIDDIVTDAPGVPREGLEEALSEIADLYGYMGVLYDDGEIDDYKYNRIGGSLGLVYNLTHGAMWGLDNERHGFDDLKDGMDYLYWAVRELERLVKDIENWVKWGRMSSELAEGMVEELERIQMKLVNKAREEAEAERMLAIAAIEDAEARGRSVPWLWNAISYIDQYLAGAEYWLEEGWLSKAVSYYKAAFYYSQRTVINAWHWFWRIDIKDWIDQLERVPDQVNDPETGLSFGCGADVQGSLYQSFTPESSKLTGVRLRLRVGGSFPVAGVDTTINIRSGDPSGPVLATATTFVPGPQTTGTQLLVDFDMSIMLTLGDTYVIEWLTPGDVILTWMGRDDDPYPYGNMFGCAGTPMLTNDLNFITYTG